MTAVLQGEAVTSEAGESASISVVLARRPSSIVTVYAVSSDPEEGSVSAPIRFHAGNWQHPQLITVTGVDDALGDGDAAYDVTLYASTARSEDGALELETFHFTNSDDDVASFEGLGDLPGGDRGSHVSDVNATGDVVVGWSYSAAGEEAIRWRPQQGLQGLGSAPSRAQSISPNGALVAGVVGNTSDLRGSAFIGREDQPLEILVGPNDPGTQQAALVIVEAGAVTDAGLVYGTCLQAGAYGDAIACRYDAPQVVQTFGGGRLFAADAAGNYAGTRQSLRRPPLFASAWYSGGGVPYPVDARPCNSSRALCRAEARDFVAEPTVVVGTGSMPGPGFDTLDSPPLYDTAFVYTPAEQTLRLPDLDGGEQSAGAHAVSADGRVIAGFGTDTDGRHAVIWIDRVVHKLEDVLIESDGELPEGWRLLEVRAMSDDARVFVGNGTNPDGAAEGFRIALPDAPAALER